tara:strand:- start:683 stop:1414 length:732 start_codon:yes stop_codon:yes gene_type:complete
MTRFIIITLSLLSFWQIICSIFNLPPYILPTPYLVLLSIKNNWSELLFHASITIIEILASLFIGIIIGSFFAIIISFSSKLKRWIMPILLASQSIPVFALAPILILWFGYGISSKIIIGVLIVFFPIASNFSDAINKTPKQFLDAGNTLGLSKNQVFWLIKIPFALPGLFSGIRVAACFAPIGAVVGEWIGGSLGLGSYMIYSNARLQIDNMFAALIILIVITISLYFITDKILKKLLSWDKI